MTVTANGNQKPSGANPTLPAAPLRFLCACCWDVFVDGARPACGSCGSARPSAGWPTLPYLFRQRFHFVEILGRGGMGTVFTAYDQDSRDSRWVAVKVAQMRGSGVREEDIKEMFRREARASAMLGEHTGHFVGMRAVDYVDPAYIALEFVPWTTLEKLLETEGPLPPESVAWLGAELLRGVRFMEKRRIVHRDLKPSNIFARAREDGRTYDVKIADLGVWVDEGSADTTHVTSFVARRFGTLDYMSPEDMRGEPLTSASDVHMVGSVLWRLLTESVPYPATTAAARLESLRRTPSRPQQIPPELYGILVKALAFDPADRVLTDGSAATISTREASAARGIEKALEAFAREYPERQKRELIDARARIEALILMLDQSGQSLLPSKALLEQAQALTTRTHTLRSSGAPAAVLREQVAALGSDVDVFVGQVDALLRAPLRDADRRVVDAREEAATAVVRACAAERRLRDEQGRRDDARRVSLARKIVPPVGAAIAGICLGMILDRLSGGSAVEAGATPAPASSASAVATDYPRSAAASTGAKPDPSLLDAGASPTASTRDAGPTGTVVPLPTTVSAPLPVSPVKPRPPAPAPTPKCKGADCD